MTLYAENGKVVKKKFPRTMAVQKLVILAQKLFKKPGNIGQPTLQLVDDQLNGATHVLDNMMKDLAFFSIKNGSTILVKFR